MSLPGYIVRKKIHEGISSTVYHGQRKSDQAPVIIKLLNNERPSPTEIARFKHEYDLLQHLQADGTAAVYELTNSEDRLALILEDLGSQSLKEILAQKIRFDNAEFLRLAIHIIEALEKIHQHQIIHKDINPANLLWDSKHNDIKIIDFGIASTLPKEVPELQNLQYMDEGTLAYISPEQTGRMNRGIDYRTDYYSLGVTFYQMITGVLPFTTNDVGELIHQHIAKTATSPHELSSDIPKPISDIIMKLMAKTAEDRYQSTFGLKVDLKNCLEQLQKKGKIEPFVIAKHDASPQFQIPEKLYGREEERDRFINEFNEAATGSTKLILISGYAGVGKSTLVHEIYKPLVRKQGYFISGKFDQFKRNIPYAAIIQAIDNFVRQILLENDGKAKEWKKRIQDVLGQNGQVLVDVIPSLTQLIGEQPPIPVLEAVETQNRFNEVFLSFIQALATEEHPLAIFLDDAQWGDLPTLKLVEQLLLNPDSEHLLVIIAYRDNEINTDHILSTTLATLEKQNFKYETLSLKPLSLTNVKALIADSLHYDETVVTPLAELCFKKTSGNPFFLNQFLHTLYKEKLLEFDIKKGKWQWEIEQIQKKEVSTNVVEFMAEKIELLPQQTQKLLQIAACLGNRFDISTLAKLQHQKFEDISANLWDAIKEELIVPLDDSYQLVGQGEEINASYRFTHDRIRQAAYSLIPRSQLNGLHYIIGQLMLHSKTSEQIKESALEIANQINYGIDLITNDKEKLSIAELNLVAARKAKSSIAYDIALNYLQMGIKLLDENDWVANYDLTLNLYSEAAEVAFLNRRYPEMETYNKIILNNASDLLDKIKTYVIQINYLTNESQYKASQDVGLSALHALGVNLPASPRITQVLLAALGIKIRLMGKKISNLYYLPEMTDPYHLAQMRILDALSAGLHQSNPRLLILIVFEIIKISMKHGNATQSAFGYAYYAVALCNVFNNVDAGYQFGQLAMRLASKFKNQEAKSMLIFYTSVSYLREPLNPLDLLNVYQKALTTHELTIAGYSLAAYIFISYMIGKDLDEVAKLNKYHKILLKLNLQQPHMQMLKLAQLINNLTRGKHTTQLIGKGFDERELLPQYIAANDNFSIRSFASDKIQLGLIFDEIDLAYENLIIYKKLATQASGSYIVRVIDFFYCSLVGLGYYNKAPKSEKKKILKDVKASQKKLRYMANSAPMNFLNKYFLIEAEKARVLGYNEVAAIYYDKAIALAKENDFIQEEAIANELAAKFYIATDKEKIATLYLIEAHYCYTKWGAVAKTAQLEKQYQQLFTLGEHASLGLRKFLSMQTTTTTTRSIGQAVDTTTIIKAASTISREIELNNLLKQMMRIVIENAGATKGFLLLEKSGKWLIEAEGNVDSSDVEVLKSKSIENNLPKYIIKYVLRSQESVVIDDASRDIQFNTDPYILKNKPKSVMCLPLMNKGSISAILYLENNLAVEAFTPDRLELLNMLSSEIVVSIDNARLYTSTKELNEHMLKLNIAYDRFVPHEFLNLLEKNAITDVALGDQVQKEMAVLFCDIRGFTTLSESMTSVETMTFLNTFLGYLTPVISHYQGFIDKYIGDAIMALFPSTGSTDNALSCAVKMLNALDKFNRLRIEKEEVPIRVGIGINNGLLVLGTIGAEKRMEGTVISDAVNIASRLEDLTKTYGTPVLITEQIYKGLKNPDNFLIRKVDTVIMKGKSKPITIYEVFDNDEEHLKKFKLQTLRQFNEALTLFHEKKFTKAGNIFKHLHEQNEYDLPVAHFNKRCQKIIAKKKNEAHKI